MLAVRGNVGGDDECAQEFARRASVAAIGVGRPGARQQRLQEVRLVQDRVQHAHVMLLHHRAAVLRTQQRAYEKSPARDRANGWLVLLPASAAFMSSHPPDFQTFAFCTQLLFENSRFFSITLIPYL